MPMAAASYGFNIPHDSEKNNSHLKGSYAGKPALSF